MALDFPNNPYNGLLYSDATSGDTWRFDGVKWEGYSGSGGGGSGGTPSIAVGPGLKLDKTQEPWIIDVATPYLPLTGGVITGDLYVYNELRVGNFLRIDDSFHPFTEQWKWYAEQGDIYLWNNNNNLISMKANWDTGVVSFPMGVQSTAWVFYDATFTTQRWQWAAHDGMAYLNFNNIGFDPEGWVIGAQYTNGDVFTHFNLFVQQNLVVQGYAVARTWRIMDYTQFGQYWELYASGSMLRLRSDSYADWLTIDHTTGTLRAYSGIETTSHLRWYDPYYPNLSQYFEWWASQGTAYLSSNFGTNNYTTLLYVDYIGGIVHFPSGAESKAGFWVTDQTFDGGNPPTNPKQLQQWRWLAKAGNMYYENNNPALAGTFMWGIEWLTGTIFIGHDFHIFGNLIVEGTGSSAGWIFLDTSNRYNSWKWYANNGYARLYSSFYNSDYITINQNGGTLLSLGGIQTNSHFQFYDPYYAGLTRWFTWWATQGTAYLTSNYQGLGSVGFGATVLISIDWVGGIVHFPSGAETKAAFYVTDQVTAYASQVWRWYANNQATYLASNGAKGWSLTASYNTGEVFIQYNLYAQQNFIVQGTGQAGQGWIFLDQTTPSNSWRLYASGGYARLWSSFYGSDYITINQNGGTLLSLGGIQTNSHFQFYDPFYSGLSRWFTWWASQGTGYLTSNYQGAGSTGFGATVIFSFDWIGGIVHFPSGAESRIGFFVTDQIPAYATQVWHWWATGQATYIGSNSAKGWSLSVSYTTGEVFSQYNLYAQQSLFVQGIGQAGQGWIFLDRVTPGNSWTLYASGGYARLYSSYYGGDYVTIDQNGGTTLFQGPVRTNSSFTFYDPFYANYAHSFTWWSSQGTGYLTSNYQGAGSAGFGATVMISFDWTGGIVHFPSGAESRAGFYVTDQTFTSQVWRWYANGGMTYLAGGPDWGWGVQWTTGNTYTQHNLYVQQALVVQGTGQTGQGWIFLDRATPGNQWQWYANGGYARLSSSFYNGDYITINQNGGTLLSLGGIQTNSHFQFYDPFYSGLSRWFTWWASQGKAYLTSNYQGTASNGFGATVMMSFDWVGGIVHFPSGAESIGGFYVTDQVPAYAGQVWHWYATGQSMYIASNGGGNWSLSASYTTGDVFIQHTLYGQAAITAQGAVTTSDAFYFRSRTTPTQMHCWYAHDGLMALFSDNYGDYLTIERSGGKVFAQGLYETNAGLQLDDPFYAARSRYWTLYAVQGVGYLWSNSNAAGGGVVAFAADWATGVVTFPHGVNLPGGLLFTDSTFGSQTWKLWAHDGMAYLSSTNSYDWTIGSQYSSGNVFINKRLYLYTDAVFTANPSYIYFNNDGGTYLSVDVTNWVLRLGPYDGGFYFERHDGTNMAWITAVGGGVFMGVVESNAGLQFDDPYYAARSHQWLWYAVQNTAYLWNNSNAAGGGVNCITVDYTTGVVSFPHGITISAFTFNDSTFPSQQWIWSASGGSAQLRANNGTGWYISADFGGGKLFFNPLTYFYNNMSLTQGNSVIYFANSGGWVDDVSGAKLLVNQTNWYLKTGNAGGWWLFQNGNGTNVFQINSGGGMQLNYGGLWVPGSGLNVGLRCSNAGQELYVFNDSNGHIECSTQLWINQNTGQPIYLGGSVNSGDFYSRGNVNTGGNYYQAGNYHFMANGGGSVNTVGGPFIYFDANWFIPHLGSGNIGFQIQNYYGGAMFQVTATAIYHNGGKVMNRDGGYNHIYEPDTGNVVIHIGGNNTDNTIYIDREWHRWRRSNGSDKMTLDTNATLVVNGTIQTMGNFWWRDAQYTSQVWQWYASGGYARMWSSNAGDVMQINWASGLVTFTTGIQSSGGWYFTDVDYGAQYRLWAHGHSAFLDGPAGWAWAIQENNSNMFVHFQLYCQQDLIVQWNIYQSSQYHYFSGATGDVNGQSGPLIYMDGTNTIFKTGTGNGSFYFRNYWTGTMAQIDASGVLWLGGVRHSQSDGGYVRIYRPDGNYAIQIGQGDACNYYDNQVHRFRDRGGTVQVYSDGGTFYVTQYSVQKPGGGEWQNYSDVRLKEEIADYRAGLNEILQLRPVTYKFNGRGGMLRDGRTLIGLVADEAVKSMPEMVSSRRGRLDPGDAQETDILTLDSSALKFALLNALKEMNERLTRIEERMGRA